MEGANSVMSSIAPQLHSKNIKAERGLIFLLLDITSLNSRYVLHFSALFLILFIPLNV